MRAKVNGVELEGSADEISHIINELLSKPEQHKSAAFSKDTLNSTSQPEKKGATSGIRRRKKVSAQMLAEIKERYPREPSDKLARELGISLGYLRCLASKMRVRKVAFTGDRAEHMAMMRRALERKLAAQNADRSFPQFETVPENLQPVLRDMLKRIIEGKGNLSFNKDGFAIGITSVREWGEFLAEAAAHFSQLSRYFDVRNEFSVSDHKLRYGPGV